MQTPTRRRFLGAVGSGGGVLVAGCTGGGSEVESDDAGDDPADTGGGDGDADDDGGDTAEDAPTEGAPPTVDRGLPEDYTIEELVDASRSGGPAPDGIPSIDDPVFAPADDPPGNLDDGDPVFGVVLDGEARAYPQHVLVWHEIVNDEIGGTPAAVTYCPLTGTAQGFYRGDTEFGVSGQLINTNLVMFDREDEGWWPQILARGITGPNEGAYLEEFQVIWTTWERWRETHPDTVVLTEDTGFARDYGRDPYGAYNPPSGYYENESTLFPPLATDDRFHPKEVVIGARNRDGAMAVPKATLREDPVVEGQVGEVPHVTVYDPALDTGFVYRNPDGVEVAADGGEYAVDGEAHAPDSLPLERQIAFDAMWLAWYGYYPSTVVHG